MMIYLIVLTCGLVGVTETLNFYQAETNESVSVKWDTQIKPDMSTTNLLCVFQSEAKRVLFFMQDGAEVSKLQDQQFAGRVQCDVHREGRIRLNVSRLRTDDSGLYWCKLTTIYGEALANDTFVLNVTTTKSGLTTKKDAKHPPRGPKQGEDNPTRAGEGWAAAVLAVPVAVVTFVCCLVYTTQRSEDQQQDPDQDQFTTIEHLNEQGDADIT